jgi:hypothetical protein
MADRPARDPYAALAQRIDAIERKINDLSVKSLMLPILDAAPSSDYPGNAWVYPDGRLVVRMKDGTLRQFSSAAATAASGTNPTPPAQAKTITTEWTATWGQAYRESGGFTGADNSKLHQGSSGDSYNGRQRSLIGFDYASIQSALSGSQISAVRLWIYTLHTWYYNGGTFWAGTHNNASKPGTWGGTVGRDFITSFHVPNTGANWYNLSTEFGATLRNGTGKGLTLQAPNNDRTFYGYAAGGPGTPTSQMPRISTTYVK